MVRRCPRCLSKREISGNGKDCGLRNAECNEDLICRSRHEDLVCEYSGLCELGISRNPGNLHARGHSVRITPETRNIGAKCGASGARRPRTGRSPEACAAVSLPCTGRRAVGCGVVRAGCRNVANWERGAGQGFRFGAMWELTKGVCRQASVMRFRNGRKWEQKLLACGVRREPRAVFGGSGKRVVRTLLPLLPKTESLATRSPAGCVRGCSATGRLLGCAVCRAVGCGGA